MRYIDVIMVLDSRCARATRRRMEEYGETGLVVYREKGKLHVVFKDGSSIAASFDMIVDYDTYSEINLYEQNVAWPGDVLRWDRLPEGYVVWCDDGRYKKVGGVWCRLSSKNYVCICTANAEEFLPKAWFR